jgi:lipopolysaccharide export system protein LptA
MPVEVKHVKTGKYNIVETKTGKVVATSKSKRRARIIANIRNQAHRQGHR